MRSFALVSGSNLLYSQKIAGVRKIVIKEQEMIEFQTEGMSCGHCVKAVTQALQAVDAAARVEVDLATQTVRVESSAARAALVAAMDEAGYPVLA